MIYMIQLYTEEDRIGKIGELSNVDELHKNENYLKMFTTIVTSTYVSLLRLYQEKKYTVRDNLWSGINNC